MVLAWLCSGVATGADPGSCEAAAAEVVRRYDAGDLASAWTAAGEVGRRCGTPTGDLPAQATELARRAADRSLEPSERTTLADRAALWVIAWRGEGDPATADALEVVAALAHDRADVVRATDAAERILEIRRRVLGPDHPDTLEWESNLAVFHHERGRFDLAAEQLERVLAARERTLGPDHPDVATTLANLASVLSAGGDARRALPLAERAVEIRERTLGPDDVETAEALRKLADIRMDLGAREEVIPVLERVVTITERAAGPDHPDTARALNSLAVAHEELGDFAAALPLFERSLAIVESALGPDHPITALALNNVAHALVRLAAHDRARALVERALEIQQRVLGPDHPHVALSLSKLASIHQRTGDLPEAIRLDRQVLELRERTLGPDHPLTAMALNNLAVAMGDAGDHAGALPLQERALAITESRLGPDHPETARSYANLGTLLWTMGDLDRARPLMERAIEVRVATLGPSHVETAATWRFLAALHQESGALGLAVDATRACVESEEGVLAGNLGRGDPEERRAFLATVQQTTEFLLSLQLQHVPDEARTAAIAAETVLRRKGRLLEIEGDALRSVREHLDEDGRALLDALEAAATRLDELHRSAPANESDRERWRAAVDGAAAAFDDAARRLADESAEYRAIAAPVGLDDVAAHVPDRAALVEWVVWRPFLSERGSWQRLGEPRYAAYVVRREGLVGWADLGPAAAVDAAVRDLREAIAARGDPLEASRRAWDAALGPVAGHLAGADHLLLAPDGLLNLAPFDVLAGPDGRLLGRTHTVTLLTSGRDLLGLDASDPPSSAATIVADVAFSGGWAALPGTRMEGAEIARHLTDPILITGSSATESALRELRSPRVLHVATHGFFRGDASDADPASRGLEVTLAPSAVASDVENPLLRSGLVLAGAGGTSEGDGQGYLSALEVMHLDLRGTELAVLSACDTGVGTVENGDGVQGLRRALVIAGADTQVLSLWKVDDEATAALMARFYRELARGRPRGEALRRAKEAVARRKEWADPHFWAAFTLAGDWRPMPAEAR